MAVSWMLPLVHGDGAKHQEKPDDHDRMPARRHDCAGQQERRWGLSVQDNSRSTSEKEEIQPATCLTLTLFLLTALIPTPVPNTELHSLAIYLGMWPTTIQPYILITSTATALTLNLASSQVLLMPLPNLAISYL